ncbi:MAG: lysophospholipase [Erythrobacter sp.]|uniref:alpha/beta hydrolase n=1 Tax=Erythrobacter sp. TaxID=1042 RepID=UPI0025CDA511|nr:alpha/beta hydrolase [Erythrobacter sp.]MCM0000145.1 lysophospholipase [Erythrobacter sp.]
MKERPAMIASALRAFAAAASIAAPLHAQPAAPDGEPIEAAGPLGPLSGTLLRAGEGGEGPVALIIPGSGPTDRDGNSPLGITGAPYRLLAEALLERGIATVRIDKRGMFASKAAVADANAVTIPDYVADTAAWVAAARKATGAQCVWLIGHSEGGLVALAAAQEVEGLCGLVLVAAPGRPVGDVIKAQLRTNPGNFVIIPAADAAINELAAGRRVDPSTLPQALQGLFAPALQGFLISLFSYDPAALAAQTTLPLLIVQGGRDIQVPVADAERLAAANPAAKLVVLPDLNHVLKDVADPAPAANLAAYRDPALPLGKGVAEAIAEFIAK